jgi:hypothetical protein
MKKVAHRCRRVLLVGFLPLALFGFGCHQKVQDKAPAQAIAEGEVPKTVEDAMNGASVDLQSQATQVGNAARQQDPAAVAALIELMHRPDVTKAQRAELSKCLPVLLTATRKAADAGDPRAAEAMKAYNISK